jgi:steroid 5-alpha reductase family enzyme
MIKRWKAGDVIGAVVFALLLGVRLAQVTDGSWLALPLAVQSGLAAFLFLTRREEKNTVPVSRKLTAWLAAILPFGLQPTADENVWLVVSFAGVVFSLWGLASLGRSFGIAPADRGLAVNGAYRLVRHPMYLGELISFLGVVLSNPNVWNVLLFCVIVLIFILRIGWEERVLNDYDHYAQTVRWRLLPGIW